MTAAQDGAYVPCEASPCDGSCRCHYTTADLQEREQVCPCREQAEYGYCTCDKGDVATS